MTPPISRNPSKPHEPASAVGKRGNGNPGIEVIDACKRDHFDEIGRMNRADAEMLQSINKLTQNGLDRKWGAAIEPS